MSFLPRDVLDEIRDLIETVSEGLPTYSCRLSQYCEKQTVSFSLTKTSISRFIDICDNKGIRLCSNTHCCFWLPGLLSYGELIGCLLPSNSQNVEFLALKNKCFFLNV